MQPPQPLKQQNNPQIKVKTNKKKQLHKTKQNPPQTTLKKQLYDNYEHTMDVISLTSKITFDGLTCH